MKDVTAHVLAKIEGMQEAHLEAMNTMTKAIQRLEKCQAAYEDAMDGFEKVSGDLFRKLDLINQRISALGRDENKVTVYKSVNGLLRAVPKHEKLDTAVELLTNKVERITEEREEATNELAILKQAIQFVGRRGEAKKGG